jgi:hypothetical protein
LDQPAGEVDEVDEDVVAAAEAALARVESGEEE